MGVGISYTGLDGKTTSFSSSSASGAIERLSKIPGYSATSADKVAAGLAKGWRERHVAAAKSRMSGGGVFGLSSNDIHATNGGIAGGVDTVSSVGISGGKIKTISQKRFIDSTGTTVGIGPKRESVIDIPNGDRTNEVNNEKIHELEKSFKEVDRKVTEIRNVGEKVKEMEKEIATISEKPEKSEKMQVVSGIKFSVDEKGLKIVINKSIVSVASVESEEEEEIVMGEKLQVHENASTNAHSEVVVLWRKKVAEPLVITTEGGSGT